MIIHCKVNNYCVHLPNSDYQAYDFSVSLSDYKVYSDISGTLLCIATFGKNKFMFTHKNTILCVQLNKTVSYNFQ